MTRMYVVVPCYNEEAVLMETASRLRKKLEELNQIYETSLSAERARYDALIADHQKSCDAMIRKYKELAELIRKQRKNETENMKKP